MSKDYQDIKRRADAVRTAVVEESITAQEVGQLILDLNEVDQEKQERLVSGKNIKSVNGKSLLGEGNLEIDDVGHADTADNAEHANESEHAKTADALTEQAAQDLEGKFLSKQKDDKTPHRIGVGGLDATGQTNLNDTDFGRYVGGFTGSGGHIGGDGQAEFESLVLRRFLEVPEFRCNKVEINVGDKWRAPGGGIIEGVDTEKEVVTLKLEDGEIGAVKAGDICMGIFHCFDGSATNETRDSDDGYGNRTFAGFYTCYFTVTNVETGGRNQRFTYERRGVSSRWQHRWHPCSQMHFVVYGSFTDPNRQTSVYETRTYTRMLRGQNTWEIRKENIAMQYGAMSNLSAFGFKGMDGYSIFLKDIYFTGRFQQMKDDNTPIKQINFLVNYTPGQHVDYYDSVSYGGETWLCVNEDGTSSLPSHDDPDWLCIAEKGESVIAGGSWDANKIPYAKGSLVNFANAVFISVRETSVPPYPCYMDSEGRYLKFYDGGYAIVDRVVQSDDWSLLIDTGNLKDGKDGQDGAGLIVQYSKDGNSWHDTFLETDIFMRQKIGEGQWTAKIRIVGEQGAAGEDAQYPDFEFAFGDLNDEPLTGWQDAPPVVPAGKYLWLRTRIVYPDGTSTDWVARRIEGKQGEKGDSVSNVGMWHDGLTVPYLGIVRYENKTYQCINKNGSSSSPLGCYFTDWQGNRLMLSDGSYIITGDMNPDYVVIAIDGAEGPTGKNGADGPAGLPGSDGEYREYVYIRRPKDNKSVPELIDDQIQEYDYLPFTKDGDRVTDNPLGVSDAYPYEYMATRVKTGGKGGVGGTFSKFSNLVLWSKWGEKGQDGDSVEYVFHLNDKMIAPELSELDWDNHRFQDDDFVPRGWSDDPVGTDANNRYEYCAMRRKVGGVWQSFSAPALWAYYSKDGDTPTISERGYWVINGVETEFSAEGDDGHSPYIDPKTGTWWEWDAQQGKYHDTGIRAQGPAGADGHDGKDGQNGKDGVDGKDGATPTIGTNNHWFINGVDTGMSAIGKNGETPYIGNNGNWWIGTGDTGISAEGAPGSTPTIGSNGNWWIDGHDTGRPSAGDNGHSPYIGNDGFWYEWDADANPPHYTSTGVRAEGKDGKSVSILGSYATKEELDRAHPSGNINGDGYIVAGDLYVWQGTSFVNVGKIQGPKGDSAVQYYIHIAWCDTIDNSDGSFSVSNPYGRAYKYQGTCINTTLADPNDFSAYKWVRIEGDPGNDGVNSLSVVFDPAIIAIDCDSQGGPKATSTKYVRPTMYDGQEVVSDAIIYSVDGTNRALVNNVTVAINTDGKSMMLIHRAGQTIATSSFNVKMYSASLRRYFDVSYTFIANCDGVPGTNGLPGKDGVNGANGAVMRPCGEYVPGYRYVNNSHFIDYICVRDDTSATGYVYYKVKDGIAETGTTWNPSEWDLMSVVDNIATGALIANKGQINVLGTGSLFIGEQDRSTNLLNGWMATAGSFTHRGTGLSLTKDGMLYDPNGLHLKVGQALYNIMEGSNFSRGIKGLYGTPSVQPKVIADYNTLRPALGSVNMMSYTYDNSASQTSASVVKYTNYFGADFSVANKGGAELVPGKRYTLTMWLASENLYSATVELGGGSKGSTYQTLVSKSVLADINGNNKWSKVVISFTQISFAYLHIRLSYRVMPKCVGSLAIQAMTLHEGEGQNIDLWFCSESESTYARSLLACGIDIYNKKMTFTADQLEARNLLGYRTMWLDDVGNLVVAGSYSNQVMQIDDVKGINTHVLIKNEGTGEQATNWDWNDRSHDIVSRTSKTYSLDLLRCGNILEIANTIQRDIFLPFYIDDQCYSRTATRFDTGELHLMSDKELRALLGKRITIYTKFVATGGTTSRLYVGPYMLGASDGNVETLRNELVQGYNVLKFPSSANPRAEWQGVLLNRNAVVTIELACGYLQVDSQSTIVYYWRVADLAYADTGWG